MNTTQLSREDVMAALSKREWEIVESIKKGLIYKEVGLELHISAETVKKHLQNIYGKLDVRNKTEAIYKLFG